MRHQILLLFILMITIPGCNFVGGTIGVGSQSGVGIAFSAYGDFLYSGNGEAYANNRKGMEEFLARNYPAARKTFETTLEKYPENPDATYYLGLTQIYLGDRASGYALLKSYRDPFNAPMVQNVKWWANYCQKRPDMTPDTIYKTMNKARGEGYMRKQEYDWDRRRW